MTTQPLRVMIVQQDALLAQKLAQEIRACGEVVVGPFSDAAQAMEVVGTVHAAILDVEARDKAAFRVADRLMDSDVPFVFVTEGGEGAIPARFNGHRTYRRARHVVAMLDDLHRQHRRAALRQDENPKVVVADMMSQARGVMPDPSSAERLVEAVLLRAVAETVARPAPPSFRPWLLGLLDDEILHRRRRHLH